MESPSQLVAQGVVAYWYLARARTADGTILQNGMSKVKKAGKKMTCMPLCGALSLREPTWDLNYRNTLIHALKIIGVILKKAFIPATTGVSSARELAGQVAATLT